MPSKKIINKKSSVRQAQDKNLKSEKSTVRKTVVHATAKPTNSVRGSLSAHVYDTKGTRHGSFALPKEIFGAKINGDLMAQAVRVYLANQRQGNANTKGRSDVSKTSAKWYRQKGTGRARHGAKSAPIFVGGGVAHGPKARDFSLELPKKMKKSAILSALSMKALAGEIKVLSGFAKIEAKTKVMDQAIKKINDDKKGKSTSLLVIPAKPKDAENVYRAGRNIENLKISSANLLNTYEILKYKNLLFMKESIDALTELRGSSKKN